MKPSRVKKPKKLSTTIVSNSNMIISKLIKCGKNKIQFSLNDFGDQVLKLVERTKILNHLLRVRRFDDYI